MLMQPALLPAVRRGRQAHQQLHRRDQRRPGACRHHHRRQRARGARPPVRREVLLRGGPQAPAGGVRRPSGRGRCSRRPSARCKAKADRIVALAEAPRRRRAAGRRRRRRRRARRAPGQGRPRDERRRRVHERQQGVMGGYYAAAAGENDRGGARHRRPLPPALLPATSRLRPTRAASWPWPTSWIPSAACSPSGQAPTGSSDPFALRRSAIGIVGYAAKRACPCRCPPRSTRRSAPTRMPGSTTIGTRSAPKRARLLRDAHEESWLRDGGCAPDAVEAVLADGS